MSAAAEAPDSDLAPVEVLDEELELEVDDAAAADDEAEGESAEPGGADLAPWGEDALPQYVTAIGTPLTGAQLRQIVTRLPMLPEKAARLLLLLGTWMSNDTFRCVRRVKFLASRLGCSDRHARRVVGHLKDIGAVRVHHRKRTIILHDGSKRREYRASEFELVADVLRQLVIEGWQAMRSAAVTGHAQSKFVLRNRRDAQALGKRLKAGVRWRPEPVRSKNAATPRSAKGASAGDLARRLRELLGDDYTRQMTDRDARRLWKECGEPPPEEWLAQWGKIATALTECRSQGWRVLRREPGVKVVPAFPQKLLSARSMKTLYESAEYHERRDCSCRR